MNQAAAVNLTEASTTQYFGLGTLHVTEDGDHYRYMQADGAVTAFDVFNYVPGTWQVDALADAAVNPADAHVIPACVPQIAAADDEYLWVFVGPGEFTADTDATGVAGANDIVYVSATAGKLSSNATAALIPGVLATAAISATETGTLYATIPLYVVDAA